MKKLLVLMLVFAMASAASAALTILDNEDGTFGLQSDVDWTSTADDIYFVVITEVADYPTVGAVTAAAPADSFIETGVNAAGAGIVGFPAGWDGMLGWIGTITAGTVVTPGALYMDGFVSNIGNTVYLHPVSGDTWELGAALDSVTLIPEPMTVALLGLGGLFLLRRRK